RHLHSRLVRHHIGNDLVFLNRVPDFDVPFHHLNFRDAFADVRHFYDIDPHLTPPLWRRFDLLPLVYCPPLNGHVSLRNLPNFVPTTMARRARPSPGDAWPLRPFAGWGSRPLRAHADTAYPNL